MSKWTSYFVNDPNSDYDVVLEIQCEGEDVAVMRKKNSKLEITFYSHKDNLTIPCDWLLKLIKSGEEKLV